VATTGRGNTGALQYVQPDSVKKQRVLKGNEPAVRVPDDNKQAGKQKLDPEKDNTMKAREVPTDSAQDQNGTLNASPVGEAPHNTSQKDNPQPPKITPIPQQEEKRINRGSEMLRPTGVCNTGIDCYIISLFQVLARLTDWGDLATESDKLVGSIRAWSMFKRSLQGTKPQTFNNLRTDLLSM
jgi:hypothetical protein